MGETLASMLERMQVLLETAKLEETKFTGGIKASASRLRKAMMEIKVLAQDIRVATQNEVNALKK